MNLTPEEKEVGRENYYDAVASHDEYGDMDRRDFLRHAGSGLGGIALTALLAEQDLIAAGDTSPIRPEIRPEAPLAARAAHYAPKANQVTSTTSKLAQITTHLLITSL